MPISRENAKRYPKNWREISDRIRFVRADGRCECTGQCGIDHGGRCERKHGAPLATDGNGRCTILTTMHLDHTPENCGDDNLMAACQRCHNRYDRPHRNANAAATRRGRKAMGDLLP